MYNINVQRLVILALLNHFVKKNIKKLDTELFEVDHIEGGTLYSCSSCSSVISNIFTINKLTRCPLCFYELKDINDFYNI